MSFKGRWNGLFSDLIMAAYIHMDLPWAQREQNDLLSPPGDFTQSNRKQNSMGTMKEGKRLSKIQINVWILVQQIKSSVGQADIAKLAPKKPWQGTYILTGNMSSDPGAGPSTALPLHQIQPCSITSCAALLQLLHPALQHLLLSQQV